MSESIELMLIPISDNVLIAFPNQLVHSIYPYAPYLNVDECSEFVIGSLLIQNEIVPMLDFSFSGKEVRADDRIGFRIVLTSTISENAAYPYYAILAHSKPFKLTVNNSQLQALNKNHHRYVAQYFSLANEPQTENKEIIIIDLDVFEADLKMK